MKTGCSWLLVVSALAGAAGCGAATTEPSPAPVRTGDVVGGQCLEPDDINSPWLVGLNATDRQTIAGSAAKGVVLVKQGECGTFKMLPDCYLPDLKYSWEPAQTVQADAVEISSLQEMQRKIPLAVAKYAAHMSSTQRWSLDYVTSGERSYGGTIESIDWSKLRESCRHATHYAYKIATGAFQLSRSSARAQERETQVGPADFESRARRDKLEQSESGSYESCASEKDPSARACQGLLRLSVERLPAGVRPRGAARVREGAIGAGDEDWRPKPGAAEAVVSFSSAPPGAVVLLDGALLCQSTPCSKQVVQGVHQISLQREKYLPREEQVRVTGNASLAYELSPDFGRVTVTSEPPGLSVQIDGKPAGTTPLDRQELSPGAHRVLVVSPCHAEAGEELNLKRGEARTVATRPKAREGAIEVSAEDPSGNAVVAEIYVDGSKVGTTPGTYKVSICAKRIEVRSAAQGVWSSALGVEEKKVSSFRAKMSAPAVAPPPPASAGGSCPAGMAFIPAGSFMMGSNGDDDEKPVHRVSLGGYCMDLYEVTVEGYRRCTGCAAPHTGTYCNWGVAGRDRHPVNCVDWNQATAYCQSVGKRLPTEEEWEYAARGSEARTYPWGNTAPGSQLCWKRWESKEGTCAVGRYPAGKTPLGLFDMAGNAWEWTASRYCPYSSKNCANESRVPRGGSWSFGGAGNVRAADRSGDAPTNCHSDIGFRCAR
ncbi:MAG: SUMF1/EgtB/PvdO family nonheme iron enzyme [Deltaproteobacteria bacterium]|nr:SUMF1/EgtB/PvdO family nonheme iron enzyme [Deltaproteobacteria bacterium]